MASMEDASKMWERIGALDAKSTAAHTRLDASEKDLKELLAWMNRVKGAVAAWAFLGGAGGAGLIALVQKLIK